MVPRRTYREALMGGRRGVEPEPEPELELELEPEREPDPELQPQPEAELVGPEEPINVEIIGISFRLQLRMARSSTIQDIKTLMFPPPPELIELLVFRSNGNEGIVCHDEEQVGTLVEVGGHHVTLYRRLLLRGGGNRAGAAAASASDQDAHPIIEMPEQPKLQLLRHLDHGVLDQLDHGAHRVLYLGLESLSKGYTATIRRCVNARKKKFTNEQILLLRPQPQVWVLAQECRSISDVAALLCDSTMLCGDQGPQRAAQALLFCTLAPDPVVDAQAPSGVGWLSGRSAWDRGLQLGIVRHFCEPWKHTKGKNVRSQIKIAKPVGELAGSPKSKGRKPELLFANEHRNVGQLEWMTLVHSAFALTAPYPPLELEGCHTPVWAGREGWIHGLEWSEDVRRRQQAGLFARVAQGAAGAAATLREGQSFLQHQQTVTTERADNADRERVQSAKRLRADLTSCDIGLVGTRRAGLRAERQSRNQRRESIAPRKMAISTFIQYERGGAANLVLTNSPQKAIKRPTRIENSTRNIGSGLSRYEAAARDTGRSPPPECDADQRALVAAAAARAEAAAFSATGGEQGAKFGAEARSLSRLFEDLSVGSILALLQQFGVWYTDPDPVLIVATLLIHRTNTGDSSLATLPKASANPGDRYALFAAYPSLATPQFRAAQARGRRPWQAGEQHVWVEEDVPHELWTFTGAPACVQNTMDPSVHQAIFSEGCQLENLSNLIADAKNNCETAWSTISRAARRAYIAAPVVQQAQYDFSAETILEMLALSLADFGCCVKDSDFDNLDDVAKLQLFLARAARSTVTPTQRLCSAVAQRVINEAFLLRSTYGSSFFCDAAGVL